MCIRDSHGPGEQIREHSVFFPRLVWLMTGLALIASVVLLGDGVRSLSTQEAAIVIPPELETAARMSRFRDTQESIRLFELSHGRFPMRLEELADQGFQLAPSLLGEASMRYLADERGFRLVDGEQDP